MKLLGIILILAVVIALTWNVYDHYTAGCEICAYCHRPIYGNKIEVQYEPRRWVHHDCWRELDAKTWRPDNEICAEKLIEVNQLIDERWKR